MIKSSTLGIGERFNSVFCKLDFYNLSKLGPRCFATPPPLVQATIRHVYSQIQMEVKAGGNCPFIDLFECRADEYIKVLIQKISVELDESSQTG
jgi:hypothetical protein